MDHPDAISGALESAAAARRALVDPVAPGSGDLQVCHELRAVVDSFLGFRPNERLEHGELKELAVIRDDEVGPGPSILRIERNRSAVR